LEQHYGNIKKGNDALNLLRYVITTNKIEFIQLKEDDKDFPLIPNINKNILQFVIANHDYNTLSKFNSSVEKHGSKFG